MSSSTTLSPASREVSAPIRSFWFLLVVSFIEGGALMAVEITGAKLVGPYYGSSLYVWAAVLGLTLGGLASGYFLGGLVSRLFPERRALFAIVGLSAVLVALMPAIGTWIMEATLGLGLRTGILVSTFVFLFPPLVCFGMASPMIIRLISTRADRIGLAAGTIYAISTTGGILATFYVAFYAIHEIGMRETLWATAILLAIPPILYFSRLFPRMTG